MIIWMDTILVITGCAWFYLSIVRVFFSLGKFRQTRTVHAAEMIELLVKSQSLSLF